jgi:hypothetical protein
MEPPTLVGTDHVTVAESTPLEAEPITGALVTVASDVDQESVMAPIGVDTSSPTATQEVPVGQLTALNSPPPEMSGITSTESDQLQLPPVWIPVAMTGKSLASVPAALHEVAVTQLTALKKAAASSPCTATGVAHVHVPPEAVAIK